eukprot:scaffold32512_cov37-Phaeocystis_antarctica.AAC.1
MAGHGSARRPKTSHSRCSLTTGSGALCSLESSDHLLFPCQGRPTAHRAQSLGRLKPEAEAMCRPSMLTSSNGRDRAQWSRNSRQPR